MELVAVSSRPRRGVAALTAQEIERMMFFSLQTLFLNIATILPRHFRDLTQVILVWRAW